MAPSRRTRKLKRRRLLKGLLKVLLGVVVAAAVAVAVILIVKKVSKQNSPNVRYLAGHSASADIYYYDDYERRLFRVDGKITRGAEVVLTDETYTENGRTYRVVKYGDETFYVNETSLVKNKDAIIQETEKWARSSCTVYENYEGPEIAGFIRKGTRFEVTGYDELLPDGSINMYEISCEDGTKGWVFGKYLVDSQKEADAINEEIYAIHKDRVFGGSDLHGGTAADLDWFPREKPDFPDNKLLDDARCLYISFKRLDDIDEYLEIAKTNGVNAIVLDIKDGAELKDAVLCTSFKCADELSKTSAANVAYPDESVQSVVKKIKDAGMYLIFRIVVFNDLFYAKDHPECCIDSSSATQLWPSGFSRDVWYYNVRLALESIERYQPNEIQFDYVRFPEESFKMSENGGTDFKNVYDEEKCEAIQNFLIYACDMIHQKGVYVSADVFAECAGTYVSAYGQYFPAISNVVDAISAMPYTDHFGFTVDTWSDPYQTVYDWACRAAARQTEIATPALVRTWLTCYGVPWWNPTIKCDVPYFSAQAQALYDAGLTGGFLGWNGSSRLDVYHQMAPAWGFDYGYGTGGKVEEKHPSKAGVSTAKETETTESEASAEEDEEED